MKKWFFVTSLLLLPALVGCSSAQETTEETTSATSEVQQLSATFVIQVDGQEVAKETVAVATGTDVLKALQDYFTVKADDGFVTEIAGHTQDTDNQRYWMYQVNGVDAAVGAQDYLLQDGDEVVFDLHKI